MDWRTVSASVDRLRRRRGAWQREAIPCARPSVPPVLVAGLAFWAATAACVAAGRDLGRAGCEAAAIAALSLLPAAAVILWRARPLWKGVLFAALLAGLLNGAVGCLLLYGQSETLQEGEKVLRARALEDGADSGFGMRFLVQVEGGALHDAKVQVLTDGELQVCYGQLLDVVGSLSAPGESSVQRLWDSGCVVRLRATSVQLAPDGTLRGAIASMRAQAVGCLREAEGEGPALVAALACGWRGSIDDELSNAFKAAGLSHLVAVSGAHLSLVAAFGATVLGALRCPRRFAIPLQGAMLLAFLCLSGGSPSAIRACVMALCALSSFFARRRPSSLAALGVCATAFVAADPFAAVSVSFALSTLSTLGIVLFGRLVQGWVDRWAPRLPGFAREALALTLASNLAATLYGSALFSQLSLVSPFANVLAAPLFAPVCVLSVATCLLLGAAPAFPAALVDAACVLPSLLAETVRLCASVPHASVPVSWEPLAALAVSGTAMMLLYRLWPDAGAIATRPNIRPRGVRPPFRAALLSVAFLVCATLLAWPFADGGVRLVMLDVGQGDAILLAGTRATVLVDTGNKPAMLRQALARNGVTSLDAVVLTHSDGDHVGCLADLKGVVEVGSVMVAADGLACPCASCDGLRADARLLAGEGALAGLRPGDEMDLGGLRLRVLWPEAYWDEGGNADSLCLLALADGDGDGTADYRALLAGDAEHEQLLQLIEKGAIGKVDVLKVGHHGSKNALDARTAQALEPSVALISCGAGNRYGHPSSEALSLLRDAGSVVFRTDELGDVTCRFASEGLQVQ